VKIAVIAVGRLKERYWREAADEYLKRLRPYATVREIEIADRDVSRDEARALAEEGADIARALPEGSYVVALDVTGDELTSEGFAACLSARGLEGRSSVTFVIGGSAGLAPEVLSRTDERLSLGRITLPHQLARVVLFEQVYRAFRISRGEPYHR
jgi:23S rRNA (pseudouridine1915-N3)-methyltransferase